MLDSSQICHICQARGGLCCPATLCKGMSFAFLPAGKKSGLHHFFFSPSKHCRNLLFMSQWDSEGWEPLGNSSGYQSLHGMEQDLPNPSPEGWASWRMRREAHPNLPLVQPCSHCAQNADAGGCSGVSVVWDPWEGKAQQKGRIFLFCLYLICRLGLGGG